MTDLAGSGAPGPVTLLTFGPMIDSETVRRLLDLYGIAFTEERHLYGWGSIVALFRAGTLVIPVVIGPGLALSRSRTVADHFEAVASAERKLLPADPSLRAQVEADWTAFHEVLATPVARLAYYHLLPQEKPMIACFAAGVAPAEAAQTAHWYGLLRWILTTLLQLKAENMPPALEQIRRGMDDLERRIADGREFLVGGRPTLSDVALVCATSPLILPVGYTAPVPAFDDMPPALQAIVSELRARPGGRFIDGLYQRLRAR